jgi:hypothetical protein
MAIDHLEDIALFFRQSNGQPRKCWVTKAVYTDPNRSLSCEPTWLKAVLTEDGGASAPYYVTNLSKLLPAGQAPVFGQASAPEPLGDARTGAQTPGQGDLVVIPQDTPGAAFLVPKADLEDKNVCPDISEIEGADLKFLAITQGAVLANIPKEDFSGMSCFLLNLLGLNSSASP